MKFVIALSILLANVAFAANLPTCDEARKSDSSKNAALTQILKEMLRWTQEFQQVNSEIEQIASQPRRGDPSATTRRLGELVTRQSQLMAEDKQLRDLEACIQK